MKKSIFRRASKKAAPLFQITSQLPLHQKFADKESAEEPAEAAETDAPKKPKTRRKCKWFG